MTTEEITTANQLIAEFMGSVWSDEDHTYNEDGSFNYIPEGKDKWIIRKWSKPEGLPDNEGWGDYTMGKFKYHSSWDWLMKVVDKIEEMGSYYILGRKLYNHIEFSRGGFKMFFQKDNLRLLHLELKWRVDEDTWKHPMYKEHILKTFPKNSTRLEIAYQGVVEFIKWYNTKQFNS